MSEDYAAAGIRPDQIRLGAVIITGETARKQNARAVAQALSRLAGDFVVATAGRRWRAFLRDAVWRGGSFRAPAANG